MMPMTSAGGGPHRGNERRPAFADQLLECLARVGHMAGFDEGLRHQRTADRFALGSRCQERFAIDRLPQVGQLVGHRADPPDAIAALPLEKFGERRVFAIDEVSEHVHVASLVDGGNFDARHEGDSGGRRRAVGLGQRRGGVVIGHAHRPDAGAPREIDEHRGLEEAV